MILHTDECCRVPASGGRALLAFAAQPGARLEVPFDLATGGSYRLRLDGYAAYDHGRWRVSVDGAPLGVWEGYAPTVSPRVLEPAEPVTLARGAHRFVAECIGRDPSSRDFNALFDTLRATPAE
jgi:hypothetical protein